MRNALIVRGGWEGHQPVASTDLFIPFLEENGFRAHVADGPEPYADSVFMQTVDLVVQTNTMATIQTEEVQGLREAIERGTGMAGWHGGIADSYRANPDYLQLIGGQFAAHPGKRPQERIGAQTDNYIAHTIQISPGGAVHPITNGIEDFELVTEQYWVLHDDYNDVLATTTQAVREWEPWHRPVTSPAIWTRLWGKGRIFVSTPGHRVEVLQHPSLRVIIERGLLWAARGSTEIE